jgi:AcrR family transcriptional regulator
MLFREPIPVRPARARLLDAAERLVLETGAGNLTLDAVAKFAGVSKGGLLYHFPSKDSLLEAMLTRYLHEVDARVAARSRVRGKTSARSRRVREFRERMKALLELPPDRRAAGAALIAASADKPELMAQCRTRYRELVDGLAQFPCGFDRAAFVLLAVSGLVFGELLQLSAYTPAERSRLVKALLKAVDDCGRTP